MQCREAATPKKPNCRVTDTSKIRYLITHSTASASRLSKTFCDASVVSVFQVSPTIHTPNPPNFCLCQSEMPSVFQTEVGGGEGEAVSSGSTWLWSNLDQGPRLDMNMERSSPVPLSPWHCYRTGWQTMPYLSLCLALNVLLKQSGTRVEEKKSGSFWFYSVFMSPCWQVKDRSFTVWSLLLSLLPCGANIFPL